MPTPAQPPDAGVIATQTVGQEEAALLQASQAAARDGGFSLLNGPGSRMHEAAWSLQSFDADEVLPACA